MKNIRDVLSLSSNERKGVMVLLVMILVLLTVRIYLAVRLNNHQSTETVKVTNLGVTTDSADVQEYQVELMEYGDEYADLPDSFVFNPNNADASTLKRLGFSPVQVKNIIKYRHQGGVFHRSEDLLKIYTMDASFYERLKPYIKIDVREIQESVKPISTKPDPLVVDINRADSMTLIRINGIGPVLSRRILRYRSLLGGFHSLTQLNEIYGLPDSVICRINMVFFADTTQLRKININTASEAELARHPYIGKYAARGIVIYREKVSRFKDIDELKDQGIITGVNFEKIRKYLVI